MTDVLTAKQEIFDLVKAAWPEYGFRNTGGYADFDEVAGVHCGTRCFVGVFSAEAFTHDGYSSHLMAVEVLRDLGVNLELLYESNDGSKSMTEALCRIADVMGVENRDLHDDPLGDWHGRNE